MRKRLNSLIFILGASLVIVLMTVLSFQSALQQQRYDCLTANLDELDQAYNHTLAELKKIDRENRQLRLELKEQSAKIERIETDKERLEDILLNQTETYRNAVANNGSTMSLKTVSNFTPLMYERAWQKLNASALKGTGEAFVKSEEQYGVNSLALAAIAYHESGGGTSKIAREKNNLFGLCAASSDPYNNARYFASKEESVFYTAGLLRNSYLDRGGRFYRGDSLQHVGTCYAADPQWGNKVAGIMAKIARAAIPEGR